MASRHTFSQIVDLGILGEIEVEVTCTYSPGTPDVWYLPNGDPGYPGDPAECEILSVTYEGKEIGFLFEGNDTFSTLIFEEAAEHFASDREEALAERAAARDEE